MSDSWDPQFYGKFKREGWWVLPCGGDQYTTKFAAVRKPRWLTRFLMWHLLEWKWEDDRVD